MTIEEKTIDFIEHLERIRFTTELSDAHKHQINFIFKLTSDKKEHYYIDILNEDDYKSVIKFIINNFKDTNFIFHKESFDDKKRFMFILPKD
jgi:hypothetical protein